MYVVRGGFRGVSEVSRNPLRICPSSMVTPLFSYKVSRDIHSVLNSSVTGFCLESKLRKSSDDPFFGCHERPSQKFVLQHHWKRFVKIPPYVHCKSQRQQAVWKLLSAISRTAPVCSSCCNSPWPPNIANIQST